MEGDFFMGYLQIVGGEYLILNVGDGQLLFFEASL